MQIEACQDKMNSLGLFNSSQKLELEQLMSANEELNNSLKLANQTLGELLNLQVRKKYWSIKVEYININVGICAPEIWFDFNIQPLFH